LTGSDISVEADFDHSSVAMASTDTVFVDIDSGNFLSAAPELDFAGNGNIDGSSFDVEIGSFLNELSGTANGQFYGPNAEEVGGTYVTGDGSTSYTGSFGATQ